MNSCLYWPEQCWVENVVYFQEGKNKCEGLSGINRKAVKVAVRRKTKTKKKTFLILVMSHVESVQLIVNVRRPKF